MPNRTSTGGIANGYRAPSSPIAVALFALLATIHFCTFYLIVL